MLVNLSLGWSSWVVRPSGNSRFFNLVVCSIPLDGLVGLNRFSLVLIPWLLLCMTFPPVITRCTIVATQAGFNEWTYETGFYSLLSRLKPVDFTQMSISYTPFSFRIGNFSPLFSNMWLFSSANTTECPWAATDDTARRRLLDALHNLTT